MKHLLISIICLIAISTFSQNSNTFFVTKISKSSNIKLVLSEGDKLKVKYTKSGNQNEINGQLEQIGESFIVISGERINLSEIDVVSKHEPEIKVLGGIVFAGGTALIVKGLNRAKNPKVVYSKVNLCFFDSCLIPSTRRGGGMIVLGTVLCGISSIGIISPNKYTKKRFRFATYINN